MCCALNCVGWRLCALYIDILMFFCDGIMFFIVPIVSLVHP
jgi:hypothetical protein